MIIDLLLDLAQTERICLAKAIFGEARSESVAGQLDVAQVVLNRVASDLFPNSVCGVVNQDSQFTSRSEHDVNYWFTKRVFAGFETTFAERRARDVSLLLADYAILHYEEMKRPLIYHFHAKSHSPEWSIKLEYSHTSGSHLFYKGY